LYDHALLAVCLAICLHEILGSIAFCIALRGRPSLGLALPELLLDAALELVLESSKELLPGLSVFLAASLACEY